MPARLIFRVSFGCVLKVVLLLGSSGVLAMSRKLIKYPFLSLTCLSLFSFQPAQAHHSFAMFSQNECKTVSGTIVKYQLTFPHAWLWIATVDDAGETSTWAFEGGEPASLRLSGWTTAVLKKGEKVAVIFNPTRDGSNAGFMKRIKLSSGVVLKGTDANLPSEPKDCDFNAT